MNPLVYNELFFTKITSVPSLFKKKAEKTGVEVFDRVWNDFHGSMHDPGNEKREFGDVLKKHPSKHQVLVALGKMNYTVDNGGFARWIEDNYAFDTGDLLLKKLPHDDHAFPILSKVHDLVKAVLDAYGEFGVDSFKDLKHLLTYMKGPDSSTLWKWFKKAKGHLFQSQKYIQSPHDLDYVTGKWGVIHFHEKPLNEGLVEKIENELSTEENQARKDDLSTVLAVIDDRLALQEEWERFKDGEWTNAAEVALDTLDDRYHETVSIATLAAEAAEWFDATPDEVAVVIEGDEVLPKTSSRKVAGGQEFSVVSTGKTAQEAFGKAAENARAESREEYPEGYSGTIAEKQGFVMVVPPAGVDPKKYAQWLMNGEESTDIQLVPGQKCPKCEGIIEAKSPGAMPRCPKCGLRASMSTFGTGGYGGSPMKYYATEWGAFPPQHGAQVERDKQKIDDKWGPAGCVQLGPGKWMFFGTASS